MKFLTDLEIEQGCSLYLKGISNAVSDTDLFVVADATTKKTMYRTGDQVLADLGLTLGGKLLPAGTEGQMLYSNNGVWTAFSGMFWNDTNNSFSVGSLFSVTMDGVTTWGVGKSQGTLTWDTGKVAIGGLIGNELVLYANGQGFAKLLTDGSFVINYTSNPGAYKFAVNGASYCYGNIKAISANNIAVQIVRNATTNDGSVDFYTGSTIDWILGQRGLTDSNFHLYSFGTANDVLTVLKSTGYTGFFGLTDPDRPVLIKAANGAAALGLVGRASDNISSFDFLNSARTISTYIQGNGSWIRARADGGFHFRNGDTPTVISTNFTIEGMMFDVRDTYAHFGANGGNTYIGGNGINFGNWIDGNAEGYINYSGYNHGTTQFRDLNIGDGKNGIIAFFDGSARNVGINTTAPNAYVALDVNGGIKVSRQGIGGSYVVTQIQGIWSIRPDYKIDEVNNTAGNQYGLIYNYDVFGVGLSGWEHQIGFVNAGVLNANISLTYGHAYFKGNLSIGTTGIYGKVQITGIGSDVIGNGLNLTTSDYSRGATKTGTSMVSYFGANTGDTYGAIQVWTTGVTAYGNLVLQGFGGNVGIRTPSPTRGTLDVRGGIASGGVYYGISLAPTATGGDIYLYESNSPVVYVQSAGDIIFNNGYNLAVGRSSTDGARAHIVGGAAMSSGWNRTLTIEANYPGLIFNSSNTKWAGFAYDHSSTFIFRIGATSADIIASGNNVFSVTQSGNTSFSHAVDISGTLHAVGATQLDANVYLSGSISILNKAYTNWVIFATRNTSGSEAVYDLSNIGSLSASGTGYFAGVISTLSNGTSANWYAAYSWGNHAFAGYQGSLGAAAGYPGFLRWTGLAWEYKNETYSLSNHNHDLSYAAISHNHNSLYALISHNHDDRYFTESEIVTLLSAYAAIASPTFTGTVTIATGNGINFGGSTKILADGTGYLQYRATSHAFYDSAGINPYLFLDSSGLNIPSGSVYKIAGSPLNISHLAASTSAQLSAIISDETGSGSLVFSTSPTFTSSATLSGYNNTIMGWNLQKESIDTTHILYSFSHRANNTDLVMFGYNGAAAGVYKNFLTFYWNSGQAAFDVDVSLAATRLFYLGSTSYLSNNSGNQVYLYSAGNFLLKTWNGSSIVSAIESFGSGTTGNGIKLFYNNSARLETTVNGVNVYTNFAVVSGSDVVLNVIPGSPNKAVLKDSYGNAAFAIHNGTTQYDGITAVKTVAVGQTVTIKGGIITGWV